ncbi:MAG TPA: hypothetical protein VGH35_01625 [Gaiellaceae bacterium]
MRRRLLLSTLDLVLVSGLLAGYGSGSWAWLAGPASAVAIWCVDCSKRPAYAAAVAVDEPPYAPR